MHKKLEPLLVQALEKKNNKGSSSGVAQGQIITQVAIIASPLPSKVVGLYFREPIEDKETKSNKSVGKRLLTIVEPSLNKRSWSEGINLKRIKVSFLPTIATCSCLDGN